MQTFQDGLLFLSMPSWHQAVLVRSCHFLSVFGARSAKLPLPVHAGKTTEMEMVPRQLASWLEKGESSCLEQLQGYMFVGELDEKDVADSKLLLVALKRAVGQTRRFNTSPSSADWPRCNHVDL